MIFSKDNLFKLKKALLKLAEIATADGTTLIYDGDNLEVDVEVFVDGENGLEPAQNGDYEYDNQIITVEGGRVIAIRDKEIEQPVEETEQTTEPVAEEMTEEKPEETEEKTDEEEKPEEQKCEDEQPTEEEEKPTEDVDALKARIAELEALVEELNKKLAEPVAEDAEMSVATPKTVTQTVKYDYSAMARKAREINKK